LHFLPFTHTGPQGLKEWENMLAHPPWDKREVDAHNQPFYLLHLTYPLRYNSTGKLLGQIAPTCS
jgi:hypothetical protein